MKSNKNEEKQQHSQQELDKEYGDILQIIPDEELRLFLVHKMKEDMAFQNDVTSYFSTYFHNDASSYLHEWQNIIDDAGDRYGFINYYNSSDFEINAMALLEKVAALGKDQPQVCFQICASIYYDLAEIEMDDSGGQTTNLASEIQGVIKELLRCKREEVIQEIREWLKVSLNDEGLKNYSLDEGLAILYIDSIPLPERIHKLKDLIPLHASDEYTLHCGEHIDSLLYAFEQVKMNSEQIYGEMLKYKIYTPARNWIINYLLEKNQVDQAIEYIKEGSCNDAWDKKDYMKSLINVYEKYGYDKEYNMEMRVYIASGAYDSFAFYERYRTQFTQAEWEKERSETLPLIQHKDTLAKCYHLEGMVHELKELIQNEKRMFIYLREYEDLLLNYDAHWVLMEYCKGCDELCNTASNSNYEQILSILQHLKTLPNGNELAERKKAELLDKYSRRTNLVKLLKLL